MILNKQLSNKNKSLFQIEGLANAKTFEITHQNSKECVSQRGKLHAFHHCNFSFNCSFYGTFVKSSCPNSLSTSLSSYQKGISAIKLA